MAVAFESFSIREYTARMRSVDANKCWPFDVDGQERQLPPIEYRKYRWWSSELQIARSAHACERRPGATEHACGAPSRDNTAEEVGGGEPSLPAIGWEAVGRVSGVKEDEDGEEEGRQARSPGKGKMRAPKKRSIVELFAVAPQIEAVADEAEGDAAISASAVDKASDEDPRDDALDNDAVEEPKKRKEESVEMLMRRKVKKICVKEKKANEEKMNKKKVLMMKKKKKQRLLKKQKKQKNSIKIGTSEKEKSCKLSLQSPVDFSRLLRDSVIRKRFGKENTISVYSQRKKPGRGKSAAKQNKMKHVQTSKLKKHLNEPRKFPIQSILKNQKIVSSLDLGKVHTTDVLQNGDRHRSQQSEKHVRFSGKDDILGHGEENCPPLGSLQMQSLCKVFSDVLAASSVANGSPESGKLSESNDGSQAVLANEDIVADCAVNGNIGKPSLLQQLTDVTTTASSADPQSNHTKEKAALDDCVNLNNAVQIHSNLNQIGPCCPTETLLKVISSSHPKGRGSQMVDDTEEMVLSQTDAGRSLPSGSAVVAPLASTVRNSNSELTTSSLSVDTTANQSQLHPVMKHHKDVYTCDSQFQSSCLPRKDTVSSVYLTESMKQAYHKDKDFHEPMLTANPLTIFNDSHASGNIIGLPLNSHGEYIHLQSSSQFGFDQLFKKQNMVLGSIGNFLAHKSTDLSSMDHINLKGKVPQSSVYIENQQKWFPGKSYSSDRSIFMPVSGLNELQDISQAEFRIQESVRKYDQFVGNMNAEANLLRLHGFKEQNQSHNHGNRAALEAEGASEPGFLSNQPRMRLMGKDFIVSRCNKEQQGSSDGQIWADKITISGLNPAPRMSEETIPKQWPQPEWATHPTSGASYENLMHTVETQKKPGTSNFYHLTVDPQSNNAHLHYRHGSMSENGCHPVSFGQGFKLGPFTHPCAPEALLSKASVSKKNCGSASGSVKISFQEPSPVCNPENVCQHLLLSSTHCKHSHSLFPSIASPFPPSPAFQNPDHGKYAQLPFSNCSSQNLPHWLLNAGQHRKTPNSSPLSFSDSAPKHGLCPKSGTNLSPLPSLPRTSVMSFPSLGQNTHAFFSDLSTPPSLVHSSLTSSFPAAKSNSTNNAYYWTMRNNRDGMKSKYSFLKSSNFSNKTRKRPALDNDEFLKRMKRPKVCTQGDLRVPMGSKNGEKLHACTEHISKMLELRASGDKTVKVNDIVKDAQLGAYAPTSSKFDTWSKSRPIKLSAGAKHILKPSLSMDQDNSMPTHSTIPFEHGTSSSKIPVSQKKPAKIYQF